MVLRLETRWMKNALLYALLFLAAMNFQAKFFYFVFISFLAMIVFQRGLKANIPSLIYLVLGIVMAVYNAGEGVLSMIRCFAPFCFYLVGMNVASETVQRDPDAVQTVQKQGYSVLMAIALGSFAHYIVNFIYNSGASIGRNTRDIWTGAAMAATGQSAMACLMMGMAVAMLFYPFKKRQRLAALACIALILLYNLSLATRTLLVILLILLCTAFAVHVRLCGGGYQITRYLMGFGVLVAGVAAAYGLNIGGLRDYVMESMFFERFGESLMMLTSNSGRMAAKLAFIRNAPQYPFGGLHLRRRFSYAHDLLLDGYDEYGLLGLIPLAAILITGTLQLCRIMRYPTFSREFKLALLLMYAAVLLEFMVEPILAGMPWLFSCYCLINGCMTGMNWMHVRDGKGALT